MAEPKTKSVLVTYLERNKGLKIPYSNDSPDVKCLEKEFRKEFKLLDKDKLKAVVSPILATPTTEKNLLGWLWEQGSLFAYINTLGHSK